MAKGRSSTNHIAHCVLYDAEAIIRSKSICMRRINHNGAHSVMIINNQLNNGTRGAISTLASTDVRLIFPIASHNTGDTPTKAPILGKIVIRTIHAPTFLRILHQEIRP